jgi:3-dehydroquinate synthase
MGLVAAADLAARLGYCPTHLRERIDNILTEIGLPCRIPASLEAEQILDSMSLDKKRLGQSLRLVLPEKAGKVFVADNVQENDILNTLRALSA